MGVRFRINVTARCSASRHPLQNQTRSLLWFYITFWKYFSPHWWSAARLSSSVLIFIVFIHVFFFSQLWYCSSKRVCGCWVCSSLQWFNAKTHTFSRYTMAYCSQSSIIFIFKIKKYLTMKNKTVGNKIVYQVLVSEYNSDGSQWHTYNFRRYF